MASLLHAAMRQARTAAWALQTVLAGRSDARRLRRHALELAGRHRQALTLRARTTRLTGWRMLDGVLAQAAACHRVALHAVALLRTGLRRHAALLHTTVEYAALLQTALLGTAVLGAAMLGTARWAMPCWA